MLYAYVPPAAATSAGVAPFLNQKCADTILPYRIPPVEVTSTMTHLILLLSCVKTEKSALSSVEFSAACVTVAVVNVPMSPTSAIHLPPSVAPVTTNPDTLVPKPRALPRAGPFSVL